MAGKWAAVSMIVILAVAGCGSSSDEGADEPSTSVCAEACSGKEVTDTGCDKGAVDAVPAKPVRIDATLHGQLGVRKSNPAVCSNIYWVKFVPDPDNTSAFEVRIAVDGKAAKAQPSEPGNPALTAWTVGVHVAPGQMISACLGSPANTQTCLEDTKAA